MEPTFLIKLGTIWVQVSENEEEEDERVMMDDNGNGIMEEPYGQRVEEPARNDLAVEI